jgi:hypothetical protein
MTKGIAIIYLRWLVNDQSYQFLCCYLYVTLKWTMIVILAWDWIGVK